MARWYSFLDVDLSDPHTLELFLSVYGRLPRAGPGAAEHTLRALELVPGGAPRTVLDLGCGPGAQTLVLAEALPEARILAIDILPPMVEEARRRVRAAGLEERVAVEQGDMAAPPVAPRSQDLVWCEGAIYFLGIEVALRTWRPLLAHGAAVAFTEPVWLRADPPAELAEWWRGEYPAITDDAGVRDIVARAGFETLGSFPLPREAWCDDYYDPMRERLAELERSHPDDPVASELAAATARELAMHDRFGDYYSYGFFVVRSVEKID